MLMVIFGAGASYDSAPAFPLPEVYSVRVGPWRPPLALNLFRDPTLEFGYIVRKYPKLHHILPYLRQPVSGRSVEQELEILRDQAKDKEFPERLREFAAVRYYLRDLLFDVTEQWTAKTNGVTNYATLVGEILRYNNGSEPVSLVTFNYDLLLDQALFSYRYSSQPPAEQFKSHPVLNVFKPHGAVNWVRFVDVPETTRIRRDVLIENAEAIKLLDTWATVPNSQYADEFGLGRTVFPAIAVPFQNKTDSTFECPPSHLTRLKELLPEVTKILIIGWQAKEAHFLQNLRSNLPKLRHLMVVGKDVDDANATLTYFAQQIRTELTSDKAYVSPGGFTDFILRRDAAGFLARS